MATRTISRNETPSSKPKRGRPKVSDKLAEAMETIQALQEEVAALKSAPPAASRRAGRSKVHPFDKPFVTEFTIQKTRVQTSRGGVENTNFRCVDPKSGESAVPDPMFREVLKRQTGFGARFYRKGDEWFMPTDKYDNLLAGLSNGEVDRMITAALPGFIEIHGVPTTEAGIAYMKACGGESK